MCRKLFFRIVLSLFAGIVFSLTGCSPSSSSPSQSTVNWLVTESHFDYASGNFEITTNLPDGAAVTLNCNGKILTDNVVQKKVKFPLILDCINQNSDGGKVIVCLATAQGFIGSNFLSFEYLPPLQINFVKNYFAYISFNTDFSKQSLKPEFYCNYPDSMLEKKWDFYLSTDHSIDLKPEEKLTDEDAAKACVKNPVNLNKTLVVDCTVSVKNKPGVSGYQCPFVWTIQDESLADYIRIRTLDGIYFYYELYKGSKRVYGSGDVEWLIDGIPVDTNILFEMKKEYVGKNLSLNFTQNYNGQKQSPLTSEYGKLKNALSKVNLRYSGDLLNQGDKIDVSKIVAYDCYDCFNQKVSDTDFIYTDTNSVPLQQLAFNNSNYYSVDLQNDRFYKFTSKIFIPVKAAFKFEYDGTQIDQMPKLSEDIDNINYGKVKFYNVNTNNILYRFENETQWNVCDEKEFSAKPGDKLILKIKENGEIKLGNFVYESDPVEITVEKRNIGTKINSGSLINWEKTNVKIIKKEVSKNLFRFELDIPDAMKEKIEMEKNLSYSWKTNNMQPEAIKNYSGSESRVFTVDAGNWASDTYTVDCEIKINSVTVYISATEFFTVTR